MKNPYVSVIIPNYCHAKYLDQRIQSVLQQTYDNYEVIILDDCSPDNGASKAVIDKYRSNKHISHIVYNEQNSGSTFIQWNKGFNLAKGELIWIAESDDYCENTFLEALIPCFEQHPDCSLAFCSCKYVNADGSDRHPELNYSGNISCHNSLDFIKYNLVNSCFTIPNASAVIFRKYFAMNIPEDYKNFKAAGDRLFWIYLSEKGKICQVDLPLNYFRIHPIKVSQDKETDGTTCRENYKINQYLRKNNYVKGSIKLYEYIYYWDYINQFQFANESIRRDLIKLWFPKWWMNQTTRNIAKILLTIRTNLTRLHYLLK